LGVTAITLQSQNAKFIKITKVSSKLRTVPEFISVYTNENYEKTENEVLFRE